MIFMPEVIRISLVDFDSLFESSDASGDLKLFKPFMRQVFCA